MAKLEYTLNNGVTVSTEISDVSFVKIDGKTIEEICTDFLITKRERNADPYEDDLK